MKLLAVIATINGYHQSIIVTTLNNFTYLHRRCHREHRDNRRHSRHSSSEENSIPQLNYSSGTKWKDMNRYRPRSSTFCKEEMAERSASPFVIHLKWRRYNNKEQELSMLLNQNTFNVLS
ncbi:hypothetical protein V6N12_001242 [Hibiscus sabdariffa]|uniref:Uncharacterized protein n=1 Tax=Hibiscus sabdariffa TaxID=183260 RepID=A0ABR2C721_9ROSI